MDLADQLQKLQTLREQGVLTEEEFTQAKKRVLDRTADNARTTGSFPPRPDTSSLGHFHRSLNDKWLGGICGGLAQSTAVPAWLWRILFVLAVLANGLGLLVYLLMWIFVPARFDAAPVLGGDAGIS